MARTVAFACSHIAAEYPYMFKIQIALYLCIIGNRSGSASQETSQMVINNCDKTKQMDPHVIRSKENHQLAHRRSS